MESLEDENEEQPDHSEIDFLLSHGKLKANAIVKYCKEATNFIVWVRSLKASS